MPLRLNNQHGRKENFPFLLIRRPKPVHLQYKTPLCPLVTLTVSVCRVWLNIVIFLPFPGKMFPKKGHV